MREHSGYVFKSWWTLKGTGPLSKGRSNANLILLVRQMQHFIILPLLVVIAGCEKNFNISPPANSNQMAVNSLFNDGSRVQVYLNQPYAVGATNAAITPIANARVELYENNVFKEVMQYTPADSQNLSGSYLSTLIPKAGSSYKIVASAKNYLTASAADSIPMPAQLITSSLQNYIYTDSVQMGMATIVFHDDLFAQNYYRINVFAYGVQRYVNSKGDTVDTYPFSYLMAWPATTVSDSVRDGDFFLFSDNGFNGQEKTLPVAFTTNGMDPAALTSLTLVIELHTVSPLHYQYFKTLNQYRTTNSGQEPVFITSNVNDGYGAFVGEHIQQVSFKIK